MNPKYENRQTVGKKLDLNMLRFQELPLVPRGGYKAPKEMQLNSFTKPFVAVKSDRLQIREQKTKDKIRLTNNVNLTASALKRWANRFAKVSTMDRFTVYDVAKLLEVSKDIASQCLTRWSKEGKIIGERTGPSDPIVWRVK